MRAYCDHGDFTLQAKKLFDKPKENLVIKEPDDFAQWVSITLNGKNVRNPYNDVAPYVTRSSSRTLVPLRYLSEAFGATVTWVNDKEQAIVNWRGRVIVVTIGNNTALVDDKEIRLEQAPVLWKDRTMVPLRFLLEAVGAPVQWDGVYSVVDITLDGAQCPPNYCDQ